MLGMWLHELRDGASAIETSVVKVCAIRGEDVDTYTSVVISLPSDEAHLIGSPEGERRCAVETIRAALAAKVAADHPDHSDPVETDVSVEFLLQTEGPFRADGRRLFSSSVERLSVPLASEEVEAARERLLKDGIAAMERMEQVNPIGDFDAIRSRADA